MSSVRRYRSGEAAKLVDMPAATLRIWEQRYGVISPPTSASGQRLYSDVDVSRLKTIKSLVDQGHAIGAIAHLDNEQLSRLANGSAVVAPAVDVPHGANLFVVGFGEVATSAMPDGVTYQVFSRAEAIPDADATPGAASGMVVRVEALHEDTVLSIVAAARRAHCDHVLVVYAFGTRRAVDLARLEGIRLMRTSGALLHADELLSDFVQSLARSDTRGSARQRLWSRLPRRFDEQTLTRLTRQSSTIACECPKHIGELLLQIAAFERYSDECVSRSSADALLHQHLGDAANRAVALFEDALAAVVEHEGWSVPATVPALRRGER
ncbi:HTH-type transcriptional regulator MlrA [Pandoraea morbifera]|uniref:HTH-type transcriptional regulator MlrA n=1 Tax=Pandoraea morbifera TaxID=2508300 RepID=A0A5E4VRS4_9BURK|nr:HTH-type transcriptional regulator MlrA [Pandoraea morbifera]